MSPPLSGIEQAQFVFTVRFLQGYRYLDRCGEALIALEETLDNGWIPEEIAPSGGSLQNFTLGMAARFNSEFLTVVQSEFLSFSNYSDQTCKLFDVLRSTFEIDRVFTPAFRVVLQTGFSDEAAAEEYLRDLHLCTASEGILSSLGGKPDAVNYTITTRENIDWQGSSASIRRRLEVRTVRQERQPRFDERLLRRLSLLTPKQQEAMKDLRRLRRQHSKPCDIAVQFDVETSLESEFKSSLLDLSEFLHTSLDWSQSLAEFIRTQAKGYHQ